jgi:hypothetical protein
MNRDDQSHPPNSGGPSAESTAEDLATELEARLQELLSEYRRVCRADRNPARMWELRKQIYALKLQGVEAALALLERSKPDLATRLEWEAGVDALMEPYELAARRTDLTIPELLCLKKLSAENKEKAWKSLLAEKQELEQLLHPGKRRHRKAT